MIVLANPKALAERQMHLAARLRPPPQSPFRISCLAACLPLVCATSSLF